MSEKIEMSLDEIIKQSKRKGGQGGRRGRNHGAGQRGRNHGTGQRGGNARVQKGRGRGGIQRINNISVKFQNISLNTAHDAKLMISNLDCGVSDRDIHELFAEFGPVRSAAVHYDRSGRSLGTADVHFERKSDAVKALKLYNGVPLDGRIMEIQLATPGIPKSIRGRDGANKRGQNRSSRGGKQKNSRGWC